VKRKALLDYAITVCAGVTVVGIGVISFKDDAYLQTGIMSLIFCLLGAFLAYKKGE